jgi:hypothetical protein
MASTIAAYPNSNVSPSQKNEQFFYGRVRNLSRRLDLTSHIRSGVLKHVLDFVVLAVILIVLFMVPA